MHTFIVVIAVIGIVAYVIGRQLLGEPLRGRKVVVLPLVLTVIGAVDLGRTGHHVEAADVAFIAVSALVAAGIGVAQALIMRLERRDGTLWGQLPVRGLWLWVGLVASRVVLTVAAGASGAHVAASAAPILFVLGVNRLAQAATITARSVHAGIPFAPEKDGSTFLGQLTQQSGQSGQQFVSSFVDALGDRRSRDRRTARARRR